MAGPTPRAKHAPPVSSPLVTPRHKRDLRVRFGAFACRPKTSIKLRMAFTAAFPLLTACATHSYRVGPLSPNSRPIIRLNPSKKAVRLEVFKRIRPAVKPRPTPLKRRRADDDDQGPPNKRRK
ncbi:uncharacterized protein PGTG_20139 [Puccinia graminis f. sp. tritici CRL 75-36-700-3]|uniref:Uncharacterized protein n=1 Tax=Puccinia graminis f. sp. tritici (strain CRL 75-36-700-3 / race SCCL) TaxID=418459 RepID=E3NXD3_PUCGT|nr:uncharacterized protein PGTG_20139 [Puccinia graminis f. sp. tritici CRL 75-36-700-3]EFP94232.2 hypothetical protein PGTG_20139 [Puccinia graminis f. sp. tritici CRL 75-36-700-3]